MRKRLYRWQFINIVISRNCYYVSFYVLCSVTVSMSIMNHVRKVTIVIITSSTDVKRVINWKIYCSKLERKKDSKFFSNTYSLEFETKIILERFFYFLSTYDTWYFTKFNQNSDKYNLNVQNILEFFNERSILFMFASNDISQN